MEGYIMADFADPMNTSNSSEATCVFRMPASDVTTPDMMNAASITKPVLTIIKGPQTGATFQLDGPEITIGRDPSNGIFLNDMTVSRKHARLIINDRGTLIEDLSSLNGTWVDGAIVNSAPLHSGSSVQIGTFMLKYHEKPVMERIETGE